MYMDIELKYIYNSLVITLVDKQHYYIQKLQDIIHSIQKFNVRTKSGVYDAASMNENAAVWCNYSALLEVGFFLALLLASGHSHTVFAGGIKPTTIFIYPTTYLVWLFSFDVGIVNPFIVSCIIWKRLGSFVLAKARFLLECSVRGSVVINFNIRKTLK